MVKAVEQETPIETLLKAADRPQQTLEAGVTTVRDVGSRDHSIFALKQAIERGSLPGRGSSAPAWLSAWLEAMRRFIGQEVAGVEQVRQVVREQIVAGAEVIKVIASGGVLTPGTSPDQAQMTLEELRSAVDEAKREPGEKSPPMHMVRPE